MAKLGQRISTRYLWAKLNAARDVVLNELATPGSSQPSSVVPAAVTHDALAQESLKNPAAFEKLVVRLIPRPSSRTVAVGDVVAFDSPLDPTNSHSRAFGYLDMRLIKGRVIYRLQSKEHHGPVANSPGAEPCDAAVVESEVDVESLAAGMPSEQ
eukprot:gene12483-12617_t